MLMVLLSLRTISPLLIKSYNQLNSNFDLMDLDALHYFLGVQIESTPTGLFAHQNMYALDLLTKFQILA